MKNYQRIPAIKRLANIAGHTALLVTLWAMGTSTVSAQNYGVPPVPSYVPSDFIPQLSITPPFQTNFDVSEDLHTGRLNLKIPLYTVKSNSLEVPISISYNTGGIKVAEIAERVGLGWNLNAGGYIKREVKGIEDSQIDAPIPNSGLFYQYPVLSDVNSFYNKISTFEESVALKGSTEKSFDTEPDIYHFSFNGYSGKIIFNFVDGTGFIPQVISKQNIKVAPNFGNGGSGASEVISWVLTTGDGVQYYFSTPEFICYRTTAVYGFLEPTNIYDHSNSSITTWYLDKVTSPTGNNTINFTYQQGDSVFFDSPMEASFQSYLTIDPNKNNQVIPGVTFSYLNYTFPIINQAMSVIHYALVPKRISSVSSNSSYVQFNYDLEYRIDLKGDHSLESITIGACPSCAPIKSFVFNYGNVGATGSLSSLYSNNRMMLYSVQEVGNGIAKPPYQFAYNTSVNLPNRDDLQYADYWGYFNNGGANDEGTDFVPSTTFTDPNYPGYTLNFQGADRASDPNNQDANMLSSVTYPTGGVESFTYEANDYFDINQQQNVVIGGVRIKQAIKYDGINHANDIIKNYTYTLQENPAQSSGSIDAMPKFHNEKFLIQDYTNTSANYYYLYLVGFSSPVVEVGTTNGSHVGYSCVKVAEGTMGYTVYKYTSFSDHPDIPSSNVDIASGSNLHFYPVNAPGDPNPHSTPPQGISSMYLPSTNMEMERGLLLSKSEYDLSGTIKRGVTNVYNFIDPNQVTITALRANINEIYPGYYADNLLCNSSQSTYLQNCQSYELYVQIGNFFDNSYSLVPRANNGAETNQGYFGFYTHISKWVSLTSSTEQVYDQQDPSKMVTITTNYTYSTNNYEVSTYSQTNGDGTIYTKQYTYADDYASGTLPVISNMNSSNLHINALPIETINYSTDVSGNKLVLQGQLNLYYNGLLISKSQLESAQPIPWANFSLSTNAVGSSNFNFDPHYQKRYTYQYDNNDNPIQTNRVSGVIPIASDNPPDLVYSTDVTLWGQDNNTYPIAKASNIQLSQLAYTSFEMPNDGSSFPVTIDGNWSFNGNIGSGAKTGGLSFGGGNAITYINQNTLSNQLLAGNYIVSFWAMTDGNGTSPTLSINGSINQVIPNGTTWQYFEIPVNNFAGGTFMVNLFQNTDDFSNIYLDELRLQPAGSIVTTYVHQPLVGLAATADARRVLTFYRYDGLNRLMAMMDHNGNIRKKYTYNYKQ